LKREIEFRRERIGDTLEVIGDRVSPGRMAQRRKAAITGAMRRAKETVMGATDGMQQQFGAVTHTAGDGASQATERMSDVAHSAAESVQHAPEAIAQRAQGNPFAAGLIAFGAGMLLATVLPKTRAEEQAAQQLQPLVQEATNVARDAGRQLAETAKNDAQQAAVDLRETTRDAATEVAQQAKQGASEVKDAGTTAASEVKDQAKDGAGNAPYESRPTTTDVRTPPTL